MKKYLIQKIFVFLFITNIFRKNNEDIIVIPFKLENNRIVIQATVNGVEGRYFWDTGAPDTITTISLDNLPIVKNDPYIHNTRHYIKDGIIIDGQLLKTTSTIYNK